VSSGEAEADVSVRVGRIVVQIPVEEASFRPIVPIAADVSDNAFGITPM